MSVLPSTSPVRRALTMVSLILAGEAVFLPAFHLGRYFKTPLLATLGIDVFQLGQLGAIYGVFATGCYFIGGPLADRYSPRKLLSASLLVTAMGSLYMASRPSFAGLGVLFGFWGVTTIFAFWAPLIRATREWASDDGQGKAFGMLDAGRGLASALIALLAVAIFSSLVGDADKKLESAIQIVNVTEALLPERSAAQPAGTESVAAQPLASDPVLAAAKRQIEQQLKIVAGAVKVLIYGYALNCVFAAACIWFFVPDPPPLVTNSDTKIQSGPQSSVEKNASRTAARRRLVRVLKSPAIWLQAVVIIAAYSAFKMIDNYGIYAEDAYGLTPTQSARIVSYISFIRVGAAFAAGWIADRRLGVRVTIQLCFALLLVSYLGFLLLPTSDSFVWLMVANMSISCLGFFALRGIYFALLEESGTPRELTGTAVGVISFVGFTPEIYMGPLTGWLINSAREGQNVLRGYQQVFTILLVLSLGGLLAAWALRKFQSPPSGDSQPA